MKHPQTPYAVICPVHGQEFLTSEEYGDQLRLPDSKWKCPVKAGEIRNNVVQPSDCRRESQWDDENYEDWNEPVEQGSSDLSLKLPTKKED